MILNRQSFDLRLPVIKTGPLRLPSLAAGLLTLLTCVLAEQVRAENPDDGDTPSGVTDINADSGRRIYESRCALCHGKSGLGDGRMAKIVKAPPPYNLTLSVMPDDYLKAIITRGGEAMGRSPQMPPWRDELSNAEIDQVMAYIKSFRISVGAMQPAAQQ